MAGQTLMQLTERREFLLELVQQEQEEGDDKDLVEQVHKELVEMLAVTEGDWRRKIDDYVAVARMLRATEDALKAEARHLTDRARTVARQRESLRDRVIFVAELKGLTKFEGHTRSIGVSESGFSVKIDVPTWKLPLAFRKWTPGSWSASRKAIADYIKAGGEALEGVTTKSTKRVSFR